MNARLRQMVKRVAGLCVLSIVIAHAIVSVGVQFEAGYLHEELGGEGPARALVLYHPSRDARFSDDLSIAVAEGFREAGLATERATLTSETPERLAGYAIVAVISNTYYWTPDRPTRRYLARARLENTRVIGLMGGAGATGRSERLLGEALEQAGADVIATRSFWMLKPNDESRMDESNRAVALDLAKRFATESAKSARPHHR